jgi:hypothetical protein
VRTYKFLVSRTLTAEKSIDAENFAEAIEKAREEVTEKMSNSDFTDVYEETAELLDGATKEELDQYDTSLTIF